MTATSGVLGYPDIVLAGAARSGTSFLAARLSAHPAVDGGAIKEPNYYSRHLDRGLEWYDGLYLPRRDGLLRLDASMSYTTPQFPDALARVAAAAPEARVIYAVREPVARAVSHYRLLKQYLSTEGEDTFGRAVAANPVYLGSSDYERWLSTLTGLWGEDRVLIVPFDVTTRGDEATDEIFGFLGLDAVDLDEGTGAVQRNQVVEFRHAWMRPARRALRRSSLYPWLRRTLGPDRVRRLRGLTTRTPRELTVDEALGSCTDEQRREIAALVDRACSAATAALERQDRARGLDWTSVWRSSLEGSNLPGRP